MNIIDKALEVQRTYRYGKNKYKKKRQKSNTVYKGHPANVIICGKKIDEIFGKDH